MVVNSQITSLGRLPNARRPESVLSDRQRLSRAKFERYRDEPFDEDILVNTDTKKHRQWLMRIWKQYFQDNDLDPDSIWIGLCAGDRDATIWCKTFFSDYVENSVRRVMVLGHEEYVDKRMLNCASSVVAMWRKLVKEADLTVLKAMRQRDPANSEKWRLRFYGHNSRAPKSSISTYDISMWMWTTLAAEAGLSKELTFDKVEATAEDVILILRTLWERPADLAIDAETRIAFHANVLLSAMGGFRPGCLGKTLYKDIILSVIRDPRDHTKKHVATMSITTNKKKDSLSSTGPARVGFSAFFIPFPLVCLTRLIIARAIQDNAFNAGYANEVEVLERPALGDVDYIRLQWKDKVLNQKVFDLSYRRFNTIWHKVCRLCGFREVPHLYAIRVGTGARLDKDSLFSRALCNFILKHTTAVFEASYQTSRVREDLIQAAFGQKTGSDNAPLFAFLRNISLTRDSNAPTSLAPGEWADFDGRKDATALHAAIAKAREEGNLAFLETLRSRLKYLRGAWSALKLADNRRKYFEEADQARAQGQQPPRSVKHTSNQAEELRSRRSGAQMANQVSRHFNRRWNASNNEDPGRYIQLLVAYLKGHPKVKLDVWEEEKEEEEKEDDDDDDDDDEDEGDDDEDEDEDVRDSKNGDRHTNDEEKVCDLTKVTGDDNYKCIICDLNFSSRSTLTGHYEKHLRSKHFDEPFQCPECRRRRKKVNALVEEGYPAWLNHLERFHGKRYTPYFQQAMNTPAMYPCPFANCATKGKHKNFSSRGLAYHFSRGHAHEQDAHTKDQFKKRIRCPKCALQTDGDGSAPSIESLWDWKQHFNRVHNKKHQTMYQCFLCRELVRTARGLKSHFHNLHERRQGVFANPFACPECIRLGQTDQHEIMGRTAWQSHVDQCHNGGVKEEPVDGAIQSLECHPQYHCLICLKCHNTRDSLAYHLGRTHEELFEKPFQCPECIRQGVQDIEPFNNQVAWTSHVFQEHRAHVSNPHFDNAYLDGPVTSPSSGARRTSRKSSEELDPGSDDEIGLTRPHQSCGMLRAPISCNGRPGNSVMSRKGEPGCDAVDPMLGITPCTDYLDNARNLRPGPGKRESERKRKNTEQDPDPGRDTQRRRCRQLGRCTPALSITSQPVLDSDIDIPIDPALLEAK